MKRRVIESDPVAFAGWVESNRSRAQDRLGKLRSRSELEREGANARFRSHVGLKTGARHG